MQEVVEEVRALGMGCVRKEVKREVDRKRSPNLGGFVDVSLVLNLT